MSFHLLWSWLHSVYFLRMLKFSTYFTWSHICLCNICLICESHTQDHKHLGYPVSIIHFSAYPASLGICSPKHFILSERYKAINTGQVLEQMLFFLKTSNYTPIWVSENFMISDVTWNKLYIMPGIRISRFLLFFFLSTMVCMLMKVFNLCWEIWEKAKEMCGFKFAA